MEIFYISNECVYNLKQTVPLWLGMSNTFF